MEESYKHVDECIAGPGVDLELNKSLYNCCQCNIKCSEDCRCVKECCYLENGRLHDNDDIHQPKLIFECNKYCSCAIDCINRVSQRDVSTLTVIKSTNDKGMGLYANTNIPYGTFIGKYTGEIIKLSTVKERLSMLSENDSCYIILFNEHMPSGVTVTTAVDASYHGNHTRFINHSCDPNLTVFAVRYHSIVPSLCFFTTKSVTCGDELCFSYCGSNKSCTIGKKPCLCGSSNCIKYLPLQEL